MIRHDDGRTVLWKSAGVVGLAPCKQEAVKFSQLITNPRTPACGTRGGSPDCNRREGKKSKGQYQKCVLKIHGQDQKDARGGFN